MSSNKLILSLIIILLIIFGIPNLSNSQTNFPKDSNNYTLSNEIQSESPLKPQDVKLPYLPDTLDFDLNIIFFGIEQSRLNESYLISLLNEWYAPIDRIPHYYNPIQYNMNYTLNYNISYVNGLILEDFIEFLDTNSVEHFAPYFIQPEYHYAKYIQSSVVEKWLETRFVSNGIPTLVFIDTYTIDPLNHMPYYYNASSPDLDSGTNPRPFGAYYQIAGGGEDSKLLWLDLSAGPTEYFNAHTQGVSEEKLPPIWTYEDISEKEKILSEDISIYINTALELRFLPSNLYTPMYSRTHIKVEILLIDLDPTEFDYSSMIDAEYMISEYKRFNPFIEWSYSLNEWLWHEDTDFVNVLNNANDTESRTVDAWPILDYLDTVYSDLFNQSNNDMLILPVFLFAFPINYMFNSFLGIARGDGNGNFSYVVSALNRQYAEPEFGLLYSGTFNFNNIQSEEYRIHEGWFLGLYNDELKINADAGTGNVNFYVLDSYNYERYLNNQSFVARDQILNLTGSGSISIHSYIRSNLTVIIENIGETTTGFSYSYEWLRERSFGFTFITMHEVGHALGLAHPHDGFSWNDFYDFGSKGYVYWLWDLTFSQLTYAHFHDKISIIDEHNQMRSTTEMLLRLNEKSFTNIINETLNYHDYMPESVLNYINKAIYHFEGAVGNLSSTTNIDNNKNALFHVLEMLNMLDFVYDSLLASQFSKEISILDLDGNPILEEVNYILKLKNQTIEIQGSTSDSLISLEKLNWTDYHLEIMIDDNLIKSIEGFSWEMPLTINIDYQHTNNLDESNSEVETSLVEETTSEVDKSSDEHNEESTPELIISFYNQFTLIAILVVIAFSNRAIRK
jgi:hypothetical protein